MAFKKFEEQREAGGPSQANNSPQATPSTKKSTMVLTIHSHEEEGHPGSSIHDHKGRTDFYEKDAPPSTNKSPVVFKMHSQEEEGHFESGIQDHKGRTNFNKQCAPPNDDENKSNGDEEGDGESKRSFEGKGGVARGFHVDKEDDEEDDEENEESKKGDPAVESADEEKIVAPKVSSEWTPKHTDLALTPAPSIRKSNVGGPAKVENTSSRAVKRLDQLTEADWKGVIDETLITNCLTIKNGKIACADKPAFKLKNAPPIPQHQAFAEQRYLTIEINSQLHRSLVDFSFQSISLDASTVIANTLGLSAAYREEMTESKKTTSTTSTSQLMVLYNLPRTKINLKAKYLAVSDDCAADISAIREASHPRVRRNRLKDFYDTYGKLFSTEVTLGGSLQTVKTYKSVNRDEVQKDFTAMQESVAAKIKSSSGGVSSEKSKEHKDQKDAGTNAESLVWTMTGGDPKLFTNPAAWIPSVDDFCYWGVIDRTSNEDILTVLSRISGYDLVSEDLQPHSDAKETAMMEAELARSKRDIKTDLRRVLAARI